ncbi:lectin 2b [Suillus clintonianus]|uniref:lectin 2b n=1 Tax=Suillus clintonianus TaxID=1904413 RepID=UPI001B88713A|nr:lectin 2b [Suillus clintonianus]KAG2118393.1 lectin 2b [Suillus clintonianus]
MASESATYTIAVRTIDTTTSEPGFVLVEKAVWLYGGGTWSNKDSIETLTMGGSGTSGSLRFKSGTGEEFFVALGVHNYKRWCDIVTDLGPGDTSLKILPEYYVASSPKNEMLWKQLDQISVKSKKGTKVALKYVKDEGTALVVHITISTS